jgi:hypothetical protein
MFPIDFGVKRSSAMDIKAEIGFRALECYGFHLDTPYHTYGLPMEGRSSLLNVESKGQGSSALDIEVNMVYGF